MPLGGGLHSLKLSLAITTKSSLLALAWFSLLRVCISVCTITVIHYMRSYCIIIGLAAIERYIRFQSQTCDVDSRYTYMFVFRSLLRCTEPTFLRVYYMQRSKLCSICGFH